MEQENHVQCLRVFCSSLVLGSKGENAALQRPSGCPSGWIPNPMLNDGFGELTLYFPWDTDTQCLWVPGEIWSFYAFLCVVISGDYAYSGKE